MRPPVDPLAGTVGSGRPAGKKARRGIFAPRFRRLRKPGANVMPASRPLDDKVRALGVPVNGYLERQAELGGYLARGSRPPR